MAGSHQSRRGRPAPTRPSGHSRSSGQSRSSDQSRSSGQSRSSDRPRSSGQIKSSNQAEASDLALGVGHKFTRIVSPSGFTNALGFGWHHWFVGPPERAQTEGFGSGQAEKPKPAYHSKAAERLRSIKSGPVSAAPPSMAPGQKRKHLDDPGHDETVYNPDFYDEGPEEGLVSDPEEVFSGFRPRKQLKVPKPLSGNDTRLPIRPPASSAQQSLPGFNTPMEMVCAWLAADLKEKILSLQTNTPANATALFGVYNTWVGYLALFSPWLNTDHEGAMAATSLKILGDQVNTTLQAVSGLPSKKAFLNSLNHTISGLDGHMAMQLPGGLITLTDVTRLNPFQRKLDHKLDAALAVWDECFAPLKTATPLLSEAGHILGGFYGEENVVALMGLSPDSKRAAIDLLKFVENGCRPNFVTICDTIIHAYFDALHYEVYDGAATLATDAKIEALCNLIRIVKGSGFGLEWQKSAFDKLKKLCFGVITTYIMDPWPQKPLKDPEASFLAETWHPLLKAFLSQLRHNHGGLLKLITVEDVYMEVQHSIISQHLRPSEGTSVIAPHF